MEGQEVHEKTLYLLIHFSLNLKLLWKIESIKEKKNRLGVKKG